ncbi:hypothetical protein [Aminobacterium colombiense]|jgi:hypothetical protein|uniref:hypothetical protein n=1 Tax=Aminobacterium colombiense TaxID=81468 RepID=UPI002595D50C|nr:hypothetical protein [uncultured Aminobacterium sp.]
MNKLIKTWEEAGKTFQCLVACEEKCLNNGKSSCHCNPMMEVRSRLGAYEATELNPEEISLNLKLKDKEIKWLRSALKRIRAFAYEFKGYPLNSLLEDVEAMAERALKDGEWNVPRCKECEDCKKYPHFDTAFYECALMKELVKNDDFVSSSPQSCPKRN